MASDMDRLRQTVESLLKENKLLNERDVKAAAGKILKIKPAVIGAGVIREVRRKLGIDRPSALAWARALLMKAPTTEARVVIEGVAEKFGIRVGPPDVTRLRPKESRRPRKNGRKRPAARRPGRPSCGQRSSTRPRRRAAERPRRRPSRSSCRVR